MPLFHGLVDIALRSVFWTNDRARFAYLQFSNVMVFDVTYKSNKFRMPFAPFNGVKQNFWSMLFEGALLEDETMNILVWLFTQI